MLHKIFNQLTCKCFLSIIAGMIIMAGMVALLSLYAGEGDPVSTEAGLAPIAFPGNEDALDQMARQITIEAGGLEDVMPAAGDASTDTSPSELPQSERHLSPPPSEGYPPQPTSTGHVSPSGPDEGG